MALTSPKYHTDLFCHWRHRHGHVCHSPQTWRPFSGSDNRLYLPHCRRPLHDGKVLWRSPFIWIVKVWFRSNSVASVLQGRIACANVLSDLYAMGVTECDNMLMLLGISNKMSEKVLALWMCHMHNLILKSANHPLKCVCIMFLILGFDQLLISWLFTGERQSNTIDHPRIQGCVRGGRDICNRRTNSA